MFHDEAVYPDAHAFNPGRFLRDGQIDPNVEDPELQLFGHGRRYRVIFLSHTNGVHLTPF